MKNHKFPIRDIQFHEEGLRSAASANMSIEEAQLVAWHSTAIAYLTLGASRGLDSPAAEREDGEGRIHAAPIEDFLIPATDSHGLTYFKHTFKENSVK